MTEDDLVRIESGQHYRKPPVRDLITGLIAEVRRLQEALSLKTLAHEVDTDIQEEAIGDLGQETAAMQQERDEARAAARFAYWHVPALITHLPTGKFWHEELYPWLNEQSAAPMDEREGGKDGP